MTWGRVPARRTPLSLNGIRVALALSTQVPRGQRWSRLRRLRAALPRHRSGYDDPHFAPGSVARASNGPQIRGPAAVLVR
jgi:hypothetical protein